MELKTFNYVVKKKSIKNKIHWNIKGKKAWWHKNCDGECESEKNEWWSKLKGSGRKAIPAKDFAWVAWVEVSSILFISACLVFIF